MRRTLQLAGMIALIALTASCGVAASRQPAPAATPPSAQGTAAPSASAANVAPAPPASASPTPAPSPAPTPVLQSYRMSKAYRIVPIDKTVTNPKVVLLTFDDGPKDPATLEPLLDILDKHDARAIFFVNGYRVKRHPELLRLIFDRGQTIGNHSWDHIELKKETADSAKRQIEDTSAIIEEVTGEPPRFFRAPYASAGDDVHRIVQENGMLLMTWSVGSLDWSMGKLAEEKRPQAIIDNVLEQLHDGANILMHELPWTVAALDGLLTQLEERGYAFVDPAAIDIAFTDQPAAGG